MMTSPTITEIAKALLIAQKNIGAAKKDSVNPFFKSKYADLGSVMEACKEELNKAEITVLQPVSGDFVQTVLLHSSGEWISSQTQIISAKQNDPQAQGSAITYARRYGLQSMVFIPAEDDDGEKAMVRTSAPDQQTDDLIAICKTHKVELEAKISAKTGNQYWSHRLADGSICFGK